MFYLSTRVNQKKIITWLTEHPTYKLVVLDSAGTLFGLEEENSNSEWNLKIQPFLRDLRALGVACILLHHAGKDGKKGLRGASAMGAMAHCIFRLTNHPDKSNEEGEAWFTLTIDKQRAAGFSFRKFSLHYIRNVDKTETNWEIT
jgi:RecA-family ATPase